MRPADVLLAKTIQSKLDSFRKTIRKLPGITLKKDFECLIRQIIDSTRRIKYITIISNKTISPLCADASSVAFDPLKAASWYRQQGNIEEACWLTFLATHFGKHKDTKWGLTKAVYGKLTNADHWNWNEVCSRLREFRKWIQDNKATLTAAGKFSNHRSYETLEDSCTGAAIAGYIAWIGNTRNFSSLIATAQAAGGTTPRLLFHQLYQSMNVPQFGRLGRFDYLTMIGKLGLAPIEPDSTYMFGASGPKSGARLLFGGKKNASIDESDLDGWCAELEAHLNLYFGMQVLEDALCNWQKSPSNYSHFVG